jgi:hypothetical protein
MEKTSDKDFFDKVTAGLDLAYKKLVKDKKSKNSYLVMADKDGNVIKVPAKDL